MLGPGKLHAMRGGSVVERDEKYTRART
jgi:hypothetical protein